MKKQLLHSVAALVALACAFDSHAATIDLSNGGNFEQAVENLNPGDTLIVHAGTYQNAGRIAITVRGTAALPVVITGADGEARPLISRLSTDPVENTIDIVGATYLTIKGLEITGVPGGDGVNMSGGPSYITLEDLLIHNISVGINFRSSMHHITARRNHIYDTRDTGEGMYVGCHDASCAVSESLIEGNWIHNTTGAEQGDGIEIKNGSYANIIRDNVIHDTFYPCLTLYGAGGNSPNIVERNVVWNCDDAAIQVSADAIVRNNILIPGSGQGISSQPNQVNPNNLQIVNNTIIGGAPCLRLSSWGGRTGLVFANNAVYCPSNDFVIGSMSGVTISGNVFAPQTGSITSLAGRSLVQDFLDANARNVYPTATAPLVTGGDSTLQPSDDFNGNARLAPADAGAYEWNGPTNPGWTIVSGFKIITPPGTPLPAQITLTANPASVVYQGTSTLTWTSTNAVSCTASGDWAGNKALSGSESTGQLITNRSYTLTCLNNAGQPASDTEAVAVGAPPGAPTATLSATPTTVTSGNSASLTWSSTNAQSCTASGSWSGTRAVSGSTSTGALTANASYTLTCANSIGQTAAATATVTVTPAPALPAVTLSANPATLTSGGSSTLTWTSTNAQSCAASGSWSGARATSGSTSTGTLTADATFTLTCSNSIGQTASATANVTVTAATPTPSPPPPSGSGGGSLNLAGLALIACLWMLRAMRGRLTRS